MKTKSCSPQTLAIIPLVLLILAFSGCGEVTGLPPDYINFYRKVYPVNDWDELKEKAEDSQGPGLIGLTKSFSTPASGISIRVTRKLVITNFKGETAIIREDGFLAPIFVVESGGRLTLGYPGRGQVTLDGNGQNGPVLAVSTGGKLVMESGIITGGRNTDDGGGVWLDGGAVFTMNGGTITRNTASKGGGVYSESGAIFTMNGGTITRNTAETGGGVYRGDTFTRNGGTVSDNEPDDIFPVNYYSLTVKRISGQELYGTVTGSLVNIAEGSLVIVTATAGDGYKFVKWTYDNSVMGAALSTETPYTFIINADTVLYAVFNGDGSSSSFPTKLYAAADLAELGTPGAAGKFYKLNDNITISTVTGIAVTASGVHLDGGDTTITRGSGCTGPFFEVNSSGSLTLTNITLDGNKTTYMPNANDPLVQTNGGTLTLGDGTVLQNNWNGYNSGAGGAKVAGGTLIMEDGAIITGNQADDPHGGGGVQMVGGAFIMKGGIISNNTAEGSNAGGGVYVQDSTFTMIGGTITGNTGNAAGGGGVYVNNGGTFTVNCPAANINGNIPLSPLIRQVINWGGTINGTGAGMNPSGW